MHENRLNRKHPEIYRGVIVCKLCLRDSTCIHLVQRVSVSDNLLQLPKDERNPCLSHFLDSRLRGDVLTLWEMLKVEEQHAQVIHCQPALRVHGHWVLWRFLLNGERIDLPLTDTHQKPSATSSVSNCVIKLGFHCGVGTVSKECTQPAIVLSFPYKKKSMCLLRY